VRKGFNDNSATNGVTRFASDRLAPALQNANGSQRTALQEIDALLDGYSGADRQTRERSVRAALQLIGALAGGTLPAQTAAPAPDPPDPAKRPAVEHAPRQRVSRPRADRSRVGSLADSVRLLPEVGPGRAAQLEQLGVRTVGDLLGLYPRRYVDYSRLDKIVELRFGQLSTIRATVVDIQAAPTRTGKTLVTVTVQDETGYIPAVWFNPYIERQLHEGMELHLSGRVDQLRGSLCFKSPEWEPATDDSLHTGRIVPVYPLTKGLYQKTVRGLMRSAVDQALPLIIEHLPAETFERMPDLLPLTEALAWVHFPEGETPAEAQQRLRRAQQRLAFDELLTVQLGLLQRKRGWQSEPGHTIAVGPELQRTMVEALPFPITGAQRRALRDILRDMAANEPMTRLLQGDVGSGKTAVAAVAAFVAVQAGYQVAIMAPTELLAEQHFKTLPMLFAGLEPQLRPSVGLLTGSTPASDRRALTETLGNGECQVVVGTQALIQEGVEFHRLGLAVVDEQHRFGVDQRARIRQKGVTPDVLVMSATPIPRSLALTLHGDLDVSTLDELPPGRQPINTRWLQARERPKAYEFIREQVQAGRQAFIVFPLVEESEAVDARAAVDEHARLSAKVFPDLRVGLLHGRMRPADKDAIMLTFRDGEIDVLVATSVVEVGIDVPNATVMMIDGADRFGLAQLHQFRGRVGRGAEQSFCLLVSEDSSREGRTRLAAMVDTQDGFKLAQIDLELRGPGDFLGTRQSVLPELQLADFTDLRDLERARAEATELLADDPDLARAEHAMLRARVEAVWSRGITEMS
jgi:ATP-dependent DNA helicase RecG